MIKRWKATAQSEAHNGLILVYRSLRFLAIKSLCIAKKKGLENDAHAKKISRLRCIFMISTMSLFNFHPPLFTVRFRIINKRRSISTWCNIKFHNTSFCLSIRWVNYNLSTAVFCHILLTQKIFRHIQAWAEEGISSGSGCNDRL